MDLLRRRNMMQGGGDGPVFVDWIANKTGSPAIQISWSPKRNIRLNASVWSNQVLQNNTSLFVLSDGAYGVFSLYAQYAEWRVWSNVTSSAVKVPDIQVRRQEKFNLTFTYTPPFQTTGYVLGVNNEHWSSQVGQREIDNITIQPSIPQGSELIIRYYDITVTDNVNLDDYIFNLRPCIYRGEYGFWDTLTATFYGNIVEGASFTGGYDVDWSAEVIIPNATLRQGIAIYGDYAFNIGDQFSEVDIYDLNNNTKLSTTTMIPQPNIHASSVFFSNKFVEQGDEFPILYVSAISTNDNNLYGYRITRDGTQFSFSLVHTIVPDIAESCAWVGDPSTDKLFKMTGEQTKVFNMPLAISGTTTMTIEDIIDTIPIGTGGYGNQDKMFHNGCIVEAWGGSTFVAKYVRAIDVSTKKEKWRAYINGEFASGELEGIDWYNGGYIIQNGNTIIKMVVAE